MRHIDCALELQLPKTQEILKAQWMGWESTSIFNELAFATLIVPPVLSPDFFLFQDFLRFTTIQFLFVIMPCHHLFIDVRAGRVFITLQCAAGYDSSRCHGDEMDTCLWSIGPSRFCVREHV